MISYKVEIYDKHDLRDWAINEGWGIDYLIDLLDEKDLWQEAFDLIEELSPELDSATDLNDALRFGLDDVGFFDMYEDDEDDDDEDDPEALEEAE